MRSSDSMLKTADLAFYNVSAFQQARRMQYITHLGRGERRDDVARIKRQRFSVTLDETRYASLAWASRTIRHGQIEQYFIIQHESKVPAG